MSITRASAKLAPRDCAVSSARLAHSCMRVALGRLGAFGPGRQVVFLLRCELIDVNAHGLQLEPGDLPVNRIRHGIYLPAEILGLLGQIFRRERLVSEA